MAVMTREELISLITSYAGDDYKSSQDALIAAIADDAIEEVRQAKYPLYKPSCTSFPRQCAHWRGNPFSPKNAEILTF